MSELPGPPGLVELKYSVVPSKESEGRTSIDGELTAGPRLIGVDQGSDVLARVATHRSVEPRRARRLARPARERSCGESAVVTKKGSGLVYLPMLRSLDFWLADLGSGTHRQLTSLSDRGQLRAFDITHDGKQILFDRSRENSDIVLIELRR